MAAVEKSAKTLSQRLEEARRLLQLPELVSFHEIQQAYHRQSRRWHPDGQDPEKQAAFNRKMQEINSAYRLLKDYCFRQQVSLRSEDIQQPLDWETWWKTRFGGSFWNEDGSIEQD
jgi:DnaJ-class molecular chaperone